MKRILLVANSNMSLSGVPVVYMSIVRKLHKEYVFDIILLKNNDMYFEKEFISYGGNIYFFDCQKPKTVFKKLIWFFGDYNKKAKKFIKDTIDFSKYSVIHCFNETQSYPFLKEAKSKGIKTRIIHFNSPDSAYPLPNNLKSKIIRKKQIRSLRLCTNLIFVSKQCLKYSDYKNKGVVIYNTFDETKYTGLIQNTTNNFCLCQVGTIAARKNLLFSLKVLKNIKEVYPNVKLMIVGKEVEDGYLNILKDFINKNRLIDNVLFLPTDFNQNELFKQTTFSILPSTLESFGLVLIEAQICGVHCFASDLLPKDTDMGNIDYLELNEKLWSEQIISYYEKNGNKRKEPINKDSFLTKTFISKIRKLYEHH